MQWFKPEVKDLPGFFAKIIPYACLFVVILALAITIELGRLDLASKGLSLAIPVALVAVIAIWKANLFRESEVPISSRFSLNSRHFTHLVLLFALLYLITLCLLIGSETRPPAYFCLVAVMAGLILVETLFIKQEQSWRKGIILTQIVFLSLNLILGQTLKLPLYFGYTDIFSHMHYVNSIVEQEHITSAMGNYQYFPLFHVFNTIGMLVTGMQLKMSYFILNGLSFVISIPIVYLLVKRLTQNAQLPLIAALIYCVSCDVIFSGMYMITRTMAYILCLLVLYLLLRRRHDIRTRGIAIFLIPPLVLMHQTTLVYFTGVLLLIIVIELILHRRSLYIGYTYPILFIVAYIAYWIYQCGPFFDRIVSTIASTTEAVIIPAATLAQPLHVFLLSNVGYAIIAFLAIIGIVSQLSRGQKGSGLGHTLILFSLVALPFYLPGLKDFLDPLFLTYRLPLLLSPFIAFAAASGVLAFIRQWSASARLRRKAWAICGVALVVIYCFSSVAIVGNSTDLNISKLVGSQNRGYFTEAELSSLSFIADHGGDAYVYSDSASYYYLSGYLVVPSSYSVEVFDIDSIKEGYFLFREGEYRSRGQLSFLLRSLETSGFVKEIEITWKLGEDEYPGTIWGQQAKIFSNGAVQIYQR